MLSRVLTAAASVALLVSLAACGSHDKADGAAGSSATSPSPDGGTGKACSYPTDPAGPAKPVDPPPAHAAYSGKVPVTITTSVGDLKLTLDADHAPCTVNSFVSLAKQGFFDGTSCHRLGATPGFQMLQCGDPTGTGTGGPGYTIPDELTGKEAYTAGTIAMANTGDPDSGGSQFFLVYGDTQLGSDYTVFGSFDEASIKILAKVGAAGTDNSEGQGVGRPLTPVKFEKVTVG